MNEKKFGWLVLTEGNQWSVRLPNTVGIKQVLCGSKPLPVPVLNRPVGHREYAFPITITPAYRNGLWRASPLVGILTSRQTSRRSPFRGNQGNFRDIIQTGRKRGIVAFVFTPHDIQWSKKRIWGYTRHPNAHRWVRCPFPWPHVVYNRIPDRTSEAQPEEQQALKRFALEPNVHLFNPRFFDKQQLIRWMARDVRLRPLLPATVTWDHKFETLVACLRRFNTLYLKPVEGKAGKGIIQVKQRNQGYVLKMLDEKPNEMARYRLANAVELYRKVSALTEKKRYIVQQGIPLARYKNRPFDLRILVQKDGSGTWCVTGVGVRIAGAKGITTHVPQGGQIGNVSTVLSTVFRSRAKAIYRQAVAHALTIAKRIERQAGQTLGELSIDLGVDDRGQFWMFEANAKPMKFDEPHIRKRSLERFYDYATYFAKEGDQRAHTTHSVTTP